MTANIHNDPFISPSSHRVFNVGGNIGGHVATFKTTGRETDGAYSVMASIIPQAAEVPPHIHTRESEGFYVVEGQMEFILGEDTVVANSGDFIHSPKGQYHTWRNTGVIPAKILFIFTPAGIENLFDEIGVPVQGPGSMEFVTPQYVEKFHDACRRYGIETRF
jgi:quercetin dioxygenase-like cupin family protein